MGNEFVKASDMPYYKDRLEELLDLEEGLTDWELKFIERPENV